MTVRWFFRVCFGLLACAFAAEQCGLASHGLCRALAWVAMLAVAAALPWHRRGRVGLLGMLFGLGVVALGVGATLPASLPMILGIGLCLAGLAIMQSSLRQAAPDLEVLSVTALGYVLIGLAYSVSPFVWLWAQRAALVSSGCVGAWVGRDLSLAQTYFGMPTTALVLLFIVLAWLRNRGRGLGVLAVCVGILAALQLGYLALAAWVPNADSVLPSGELNVRGEQKSWYAGLAETTLPWSWPFVWVVVALVPSVVAAGAYLSREPAKPRRGPRMWQYLTAGLCVIAAAGALLSQRPIPRPKGQLIAFYQKGFLNWRRPQHGQYGSRSAGMFGNLPLLAESLGCRTKFIDRIDESTLQDAKVLVVINPCISSEGQMEPPEDAIGPIWGFVRGGGTLVLLGDHTAMHVDKKKTKRRYLNELLRPTNIEFAFDSAYFKVGGWLHTYSYPRNAATLGLGDRSNEAGSVIGASLSVEWPARPIVVGRVGWSDHGDEMNSGRGYMGNVRYDAHEQVGDLVLVAAQRVGKGRAIVFGDTSGFVNGIVAGTYPFVGRILSWACSDRRVIPGDWRALAAGALLLLAAVILLLRVPHPAWTAVVLVLVGGAWWGIDEWLITKQRVLPDGAALRAARPAEEKVLGVAYVDYAHCGRFSREGWRDDGIAGLMLNFMRNGYLTFAARDLAADRLAGASLVASVAPLKAYSAPEVADVMQFIKDGGIFILMVGWDEAGPSGPLLDALGFEVEHTPLGHFKIGTQPEPKTLARFHEVWPVRETRKGAETLVLRRCQEGETQTEYPLIQRRDIGKGTAIVIGDSSFAWGINLESEKTVQKESIDFWRWLLDYVRQTRSGVSE